MYRLDNTNDTINNGLIIQRIGYRYNKTYVL